MLNKRIALSLLDSNKTVTQLTTAGASDGVVKVDAYCWKAVSVAAITTSRDAALTHPHIDSAKTPNAQW